MFNLLIDLPVIRINNDFYVSFPELLNWLENDWQDDGWQDDDW